MASNLNYTASSLTINQSARATWKFIATIVLTVCGLIECAGASEIFPLIVTRLPNGIPLNILTGMLSISKKPVAFNLDTGAPENLVFAAGGSIEKVHENLVVSRINAEQNSFIGDSGERVSFAVGNGQIFYKELASLIVTNKPIIGVAGVLGLNWFDGKRVSISFNTNEMLVSTSGTEGAVESGSLNVEKDSDGRVRRFLVEVCSESCASKIFDTGIAIADVVEFVTLKEFLQTVSPGETMNLPGVLGSVKCKVPLKDFSVITIQRKENRGLYRTICAFEDAPEVVPLMGILGIRSIIEGRGAIRIDRISNSISLQYSN